MAGVTATGYNWLKLVMAGMCYCVPQLVSMLGKHICLMFPWKPKPPGQITISSYAMPMNVKLYTPYGARTSPENTHKLMGF